ncbi:efflux RND transporter periplasmic adaptor subunit [Thermomonas sp. XSG]|uniref:efflux RND transporter periplasmic adaptor subunit n=1 Tax=Thermomonas sp. XSG TaxID=2771436 RepID=UPI00167FE5BA|nr:efflux RND transporter periplasmic adaptor subunit [Thermomonas sp. XSG]QNU14840.1 efflux RND transporter periplasmic adaptor subunit [Thermomonas sp. XSG]
MSLPVISRRTLMLVAAIVPLVLLFAWVAVRSGPLAPVEVTTISVAKRSIAPALYGIGTVQARYSYKIGPTYAGRLQRLDVHVGDAVKAGQVLGAMAPVDLDDRIGAQQAAIASAQAALLQAQARQRYAQAQAQRYGQLAQQQLVSVETASARRQELDVANAGLAAARDDIRRLQAERDAVQAQRGNLALVAPVDGLVVARNADPGTTLVAGQAVVEVIDPSSLWIDARFDQIAAGGLAAGLSADITLRSGPDGAHAGTVLRTEPVADAVTEETRAKIVFASLPKPLPPLGELAEVTVRLPAQAAMPAIPNATIRTVGGQRGVWKLVNGELEFAPLALGRSDLDGNVQVRKGLAGGEQVVLYSEKALTANSRIHVVEQIRGTAP